MVKLIMIIFSSSVAVKAINARHRLWDEWTTASLLLPEMYTYMQILIASIQTDRFYTLTAKAFKEVTAFQNPQRREIASSRLHIRHKNMPCSEMFAMQQIEVSNGQKETMRRREENLR
jgi:hypothetical protein